MMTACLTDHIRHRFTGSGDGNMEIKVRLYLGDELLDPSDYDKVFIRCDAVDRIVNDIYERNLRYLQTLNAKEEADETKDGDSG